MAKRKRLTPANPSFLGQSPDLDEEVSSRPLTPEEEEALNTDDLPRDLETKSAFPLGVARTRTRPPIAQVAAEASAAAALTELAETMKRARDEGRLVQALRLEEIDTGHLVRDRLFAEEEELTSLVESLRARGQQTPIEVVDHGEGTRPRYGLISGWRRLAALARLAQEDPARAEVLALIRAPKSASEAYVAMVEENEIRVGLSYYERARIAVKAVEQGVYPDLKTALNGLFANVSRAKRSKIKSFTHLVEGLDDVLRYPTAIGERLGLDLAKRLEDPAAAEVLRATLEARPAGSAEEELARLSAGPEAVSRGGPGAVPSAPAEPERAAVSAQLEAGTGRIILEGPGVDSRLLAELERWLKRR